MHRALAPLLSILLASCSADPAPIAHETSPPPTPTTPAPRSFADFRPSRHGFAFLNTFSGSPLPINLGSAERTLGLPNRYGLCGGMSTAAADFFLARRTIPADASPPAHGTPLYTYLYSRQSASFGTMNSMALRFIEWMRLPEDGPDGTRARTAPQMPLIESALAKGEPVLIGLVLVSAEQTREPWVNHQVLAYAATRTGDALDLAIYDPNFPKRDDAVIRIETRDGLPHCTRLVPGRTPTHIRGLFRMPYTATDPSI